MVINVSLYFELLFDLRDLAAEIIANFCSQVRSKYLMIYFDNYR